MRKLLTGLVLLACAAPARAADPCHSNLMIVLDRSCSMNKPPSKSETRTKWELAVDAIGKLTAKYMGKLDFGLIMFPDQTGDQCQQDGPIYVNLGANNEAAITSKLAATQPNGPCTTPILPAIQQVSTDPVFKAPYQAGGPRSFVLFISDGMQTCQETTASIRTEFAKLYTNGYASYIVGFGGGVDPAGLDEFAMAGGVPRVPGDAGGNLYYQADTAAELEAALDAIAGAAVGAGENFGTCQGVPCPDGRCFGTGESCVNGTCVGPNGGSGGGNGDGSASVGGNGGSGSGNNGAGSGNDACACHVGRSAPTPAAIIVFAVLGLALAFRRRAG